MKAINKEAGKVPHHQAGRLIPVHEAQAWPDMSVEWAGGKSTAKLTALPSEVRARVLLCSYRQSAEMYLSSWRQCVVKAFAENSAVDLVELNLIDLAVRPCLVAFHSHHEVSALYNFLLFTSFS